MEPVGVRWTRCASPWRALRGVKIPRGPRTDMWQSSKEKWPLEVPRRLKDSKDLLLAICPPRPWKGQGGVDHLV